MSAESGAEQGYQKILSLKLIGPDYAEADKLSCKFLKKFEDPKLWFPDGGIISGLQSVPQIDILPNNEKRRYVFVVFIDEEPTQEILKQYNLHHSVRQGKLRVPIKYVQDNVRYKGAGDPKNQLFE